MHKRVSPFPNLQHVSLVLEEHSHRGSEFESQIFLLTKEAVVLLCDSTGMTEILG